MDAKVVVPLCRRAGEGIIERGGKEIDVDTIINESGEPIDLSHLLDIRILRARGIGSKKKLSDGRTLEIVDLIIGENVGKTIIRISYTSAFWR